MNWKKGGLTGLLILNIFIAQGQNNYSQDSLSKKGFQKEKVFYGGNIGLSFGSITYINLSPLIGYRFSDLFAAGVQINGMYQSARYKNFNNRTIKKVRYGLVGLGVFGRIYPIPQLFLQVQPEMNYTMGKVKYYDPPSESKYHKLVPSFLVGGGYSQSIGRNSAFVIMILYDILQGDNSPYGSKPIFRAGVNLGF